MMLWRTIFGCGLLATLLIVSMTGFSQGQSAPLSAATQQAEGIVAVLQPKREATLASQLSGQIQKIHVEPGQKFDSQSLLVELDRQVYQINLQIARAQQVAARAKVKVLEALAGTQARRRRAQAMIDAADVQYQSTRQLHADGRASDTQLATAARDLAVARQDLLIQTAAGDNELAEARRQAAVADAQLALAERQLDQCRIQAPWPGRVAERLRHEHEQVERGSALLRVVDDRLLIARFLLPSRVFARTRLGKTFKVHVPATGRSFDARLVNIYAEIDPASRTFEVRAEIDNHAGLLRSGMRGVIDPTVFGVGAP